MDERGEGDRTEGEFWLEKRFWGPQDTGTRTICMNPRIEINPAVCHGQPVIRGTRVTVSQLLGSLSGGDSFQTVLEDYPGITADDLVAALSFGGAKTK